MSLPLGDQYLICRGARSTDSGRLVLLRRGLKIGAHACNLHRDDTAASLAKRERACQPLSHDAMNFIGVDAQIGDPIVHRLQFCPHLCQTASQLHTLRIDSRELGLRFCYARIAHCWLGLQWRFRQHVLDQRRGRL